MVKLALVFMFGVSLTCALTIRQRAILQELLGEVKKDIAHEQEEREMERMKQIDAGKSKERIMAERDVAVRLVDRLQEINAQRKGRVEQNKLSKKSVLDMAYMVSTCMGNPNTGYVDYGCFCGYGQTGSTPVDAVDECCKVHDSCYGEVDASNECHWTYWASYITSYEYACNSTAQTITCTNNDHDPNAWDYRPCRKALCECDKTVAYCFQEKLSYYTEAHVNYDQTLCV